MTYTRRQLNARFWARINWIVLSVQTEPDTARAERFRAAAARLVAFGKTHKIT